jgi:hypothetical protein
MNPINMARTFTSFAALLLASLAGARADGGLVAYPPVPGLAASEHYKVRVRAAGSSNKWQSACAWETICKSVEQRTDRYFGNLAGWTHTYVSCETAGAVDRHRPRRWTADAHRPRASAAHSLCMFREGWQGCVRAG